ncbi:hypothetical protein PRUPE_6G276900 [Prunus persica]|uniref:Uncharacterized protein n=1 Tax=Prunus persica TaxID=3760 RepID=A0A251NWQ8_PRUPE|nr:hypothetical protein PRUPE_6G276900 [Prunus persica]
MILYGKNIHEETMSTNVVSGTLVVNGLLKLELERIVDLKFLTEEGKLLFLKMIEKNQSEKKKKQLEFFLLSMLVEKLGVE